MKQQGFAVRFIARWLVCSLGLWVAAGLLGASRLQLGDSTTTTWRAALIAGLILAIVNMALKPLLIFLSIPALILTLGLFLLIVNGFMVMLVSWLYDPLHVNNFGVAIVAGIIVGLVNYLVTRVLEDIK